MISRTIGYSLIWFLSIQLIVFLAIRFFSYNPTFPYAKEVLPHYGSRQLTTFAQFDGIHYLTIIEKGYKGTGLIQVFFPLYPMLVKYITLNANPILIGTVFSFICLVISLHLFQKIYSPHYKRKTINKGLLLLLIFPTSFFFTSLYTESLFLLLALLCFYFSQQNRWVLAGITGALLASTRIVGIFIIPALLFQYLTTKNNKKSALSIIACFIPLIGLLGYCLYLWLDFNDPFLFIHAQDAFGTSRQTTKLILIYQVIYRYIKMFITVPIFSHQYFIIIQEFIISITALVILVYNFIKTKSAHSLFFTLTLLLPTLTGTFNSMPRYALVAFPLYIILANKLPSKIYNILAISFAIILIANLIIFTSGRFVA